MHMKSNFPHYTTRTMSFIHSFFHTSRAQRSVLVLDEVAGRLEILRYHLLHKRVKVDLTLPAEQPLRLGRVTVEQPMERVNDDRTEKCSREHVLDFSGTEVLLVNLHEDLPGLLVVPLLTSAVSPPPDDAPDQR